MRFEVMWRQRLVAPAKAGAQYSVSFSVILDFGLRRNDGVMKVLHV